MQSSERVSNSRRFSPAISILVSLICATWVAVVCCCCGCFLLCTAFPLASSVGGDTEADEGGVVGDGDVDDASAASAAAAASLTEGGCCGRGVVMGCSGGGTKPLHWPGSFRSMMLAEAASAAAAADPAGLAEGRAWKAATATEGATIGSGAGAERSMMLATLTSADLLAALAAFFFFLTFFLVTAFLADPADAAAAAPAPAAVSLHRGNSCEEEERCHKTPS